MDTLSTLLQNLNFNAEVFFSGKLCGLQVFEEETQGSVLHFLRQGSLSLLTDENHEIKLGPSSVIFIPEGIKHSFRVKQPDDAELVCATVKISNHQRGLLIEHLPKFICVDVADDIDLSDTARRIFEEAFEQRHGRQVMIDRLCDMFMVQLLRFVIDRGLVELGLISGSTHPGLAPLLKALQKDPDHDWTLEKMAKKTAMSRSKFSALFKQTVGLAPMEYVTELRLSTAKILLKKNKAAGIVANAVGYESASSLARVFKKRFGLTPKQWLKLDSESKSAAHK